VILSCETEHGRFADTGLEGTKTHTWREEGL